MNLSCRRARRGAFLAGAGAMAAGMALDAMDVHTVHAIGTAAEADRAADMVQTLLDTALAAERVATAFYYTLLTTPAIIRDHRLSGSSADPNNPGLPPGGQPANVRNMQAALDAEAKHAAALAGAGGVSSARYFYFPATTFDRLGASTAAGTCLGVLNDLETLLVGTYVAAADALLRLNRPDLAVVIAEILGVEAEHRMLGRATCGIDPVNNLTLQHAPYGSIGAASAALRPYLTGQGFGNSATAPLALPTAAQIARVVGKYGTHIVKRFV